MSRNRRTECTEGRTLVVLVFVALFALSLADDIVPDRIRDIVSTHAKEDEVVENLLDVDKKNDTEGKLPRMHPDSSPALLVIDIQNCFLPGGAIPVKEGDSIIPIINDMRESFYWRSIVYSQDWHCENHISFATQHPGTPGPVELFYVNSSRTTTPKLCRSPGSGSFKDVIECPDLETNPSLYVRLNQTLWPPHCVQKTRGADLAKGLKLDPGADYIVRKGATCAIDSYSAFADNGGLTQTELDAFLKEMDVDTVFVAGLALDFCVKFTALDAKRRGYSTYVVLDASKATNINNVSPVLDELRAHGIHIVNSADLKKIGLSSQPSRFLSLIIGIPLTILCIVFVGLFIKLIQTPVEPSYQTTEDEGARSTEGDRKPLLLE